jgi:hypothetical protein
MCVTFIASLCQIQHDVSSKLKGQFMIIQIFKRTIVADGSVAHVCQIICSIVAGLVTVLGFRRLAELQLTEAQLFSAMTSTLLLTGVFISLGFLCRAWRSGLTPR